MPSTRGVGKALFLVNTAYQTVDRIDRQGVRVLTEEPIVAASKYWLA